MTKQLLCIFLVGIASLITFQACQEDPSFPDPGFELTDQRVEVRRDTADYYDISMRMNVPNGVSIIELINANDYSVLEEIDTYYGKKKFDFSYRVDLTPFEKDTVLNYIIKVSDKDSRTFNQGIRIDVKPFSFPEINLVGGNDLAVAVPACFVKGIVSTGLNPLKSVKIIYNDTEQFSYYPADDDTVIYEMPLKQMVLLGQMELGVKYPVYIVIEDEAGQTSTTTLNVHKTNEVKRPDHILHKNRSGIIIKIQFHYNELTGELDIMDYIFSSGTNYQTLFSYNELGMVDTMTYRSLDSDGIFDDETRTYFNYVEGTTEVSSIEEQDFDFDTEGNIIGEYEKDVLMSNFVYVDGAVSSFFKGSTMISDVNYTDPFLAGEMIFNEYWQSQTYMTNPDRRQHREDFAPSIMPTYMEGFPPFAVANSVRLNIFNDILWHKYIYTKTVGATDYTYLLLPAYTYETDESGNITKFVKTYTGGSYSYKGKSETYTFFYQ
ncbi:hypothetical protein KDU71_09580 [Carboxylicivirga sediminis]|uniref:DUF4595 domain-containing protein n=1 Tax=Carboxylicivirga sediminis TaxID=2006564 RepID=A0A941F4G5_9BACT|nr:hypothetical protein [Carboxylicivirga sediminis]MBR8535804.1 hypothetical protein [Carboxylicivirga sediminis]